MQLFDEKWKGKLERWGLTTWLILRYIDDLRTFLPPIRPGWRCTPHGLEYCTKWAEEDKGETPTQITKGILETSMNNVEEFLTFTMETPEDEGFEGWLPTLDTSLRVDRKNHVP